MTWVEEVTLALENLGGSARLKELYNWIENNTSRDLAANWNSAVRNALEVNSSDSAIYSGVRDVFYSFSGIGSGIWGLRSYVVKTDEAIDLGNVEDMMVLSERIKTEIFRVLRDTQLTRKIKILYQHKCQVCGVTIVLADNKKYSEAHHVIPLGGEHKGSDEASNIIVLCPNHHTEFDYGAVAINPSSRSIEHVDANNPYIGKRMIFLGNHFLSKESLDYHYNHIFKKV